MNDYDFSHLWRSENGEIPLFDHPMVDLNVYNKTRIRKTLGIDEIIHYLNIGTIDANDLYLSNMIKSYRCMSEKQVRYLARNRFDSMNQLATRLRELRRLGWLESMTIEDPETSCKETLWWLGVPAAQYYQLLQDSSEGIQDPNYFNYHTRAVISFCAVNQMRAWFDDRDLITHTNYCPNWEKGTPPQPFAKFTVKTKHGPLTLYIERLAQGGNPVSYMKFKAEMYDEMVKNHGGLLKEENGSAMVVWNVGSFQAIKEIVASMDYIPTTFYQAFVCDESIGDFPNVFFFAEKISSRSGEVRLSPLQMDLF